MKKYLYVFGFAALAVACTPKVVEAVDTVETTETTETTDAISADAVEGKQVYANKCTKCHELKIVDNYTEAQWSGILPNMIAKAKLDEASSQKLTEYINWELKH